MGLARSMSIVKMEREVRLDDMCHRRSLVRQNVCVFAFQKTDNWKVPEINLSGYLSHKWDGKERGGRWENSHVVSQSSLSGAPFMGKT